jgi:hypothetical protein
MNKNVIQSYVAQKVSRFDPVFAEARTKMDRSEFVELVMSQPVDEFPKNVVQSLENAVIKKCGVNRKNSLFKHPTIGQRITDVFGTYTEDDIMCFFKEETGLSIRDLDKATIGGQTITRPALIWSIDKLESATGRCLTLPESDAPLAYLGEKVTLREIAQYFSVNKPTEQAVKLRRLYTRHLKNSEDVSIKRYLELLKASYRICAEVPETVTDEELMKSTLGTWVPKGCSDQDWRLPIIWLEDYLNLRNQLTGWVVDAMTVEGLFKVLCTQKRVQLHALKCKN